MAATGRTRMQPVTANRASLIRCLLLGPFACRSRLARIAGIAAVLLATLLTCVGGLAAWPACGAFAMHMRHAWRLAAGVACVGYAVATFAVAPGLAHVSGRVALPCDDTGPLRAQSLLYCLANRHYVVPALRDTAMRIAQRMQRNDPRTIVRYLDGGFPIGGLPMLPHLSHGDGRKLDLALLYRDADGTPQARSDWWLGYFAYVAPPPGTPPACPPRWFDLRWDLDPLQPWIATSALDDARTRMLLQTSLDDGAIAKMLLEPHLQQRLRLRHGALRFQGCRAARHDDHVHVQL